MLVYAHNIIIDHGDSTQGHGREVFNGLNATNKRFLSMLITNVQFPGVSRYDKHISMHTSTQK